MVKYSTLLVWVREFGSICNCLGMEEAGRGGNRGLLTEGHREFWGMIAKFKILIVVMTS